MAGNRSVFSRFLFEKTNDNDSLLDRQRECIEGVAFSAFHLHAIYKSVLKLIDDQKIQAIKTVFESEN